MWLIIINPTDFAGHRYNSAAATAQPVMKHDKEDSAVSGTVTYMSR